MLMSVSRKHVLQGVFVCSLFALSGALVAKEDDVPDMAFLEYLGSWDESDEDWLLVTDPQTESEELEKEGRSDPALQSEESTETEYER